MIKATLPLAATGPTLLAPVCPCCGLVHIIYIVNAQQGTLTHLTPWPGVMAGELVAPAGLAAPALYMFLVATVVLGSTAGVVKAPWSPTCPPPIGGRPKKATGSSLMGHTHNLGRLLLGPVEGPEAKAPAAPLPEGVRG